MPEFEPGSSHIAKATMTNPTSKAFDYSAELYMGTDLALMVSTNFHLEAGESKEISLSVTMPSAPGTYPVYIGVFSAGENIALYRAVEDVAIIISVVPWEFSNEQCWLDLAGFGVWKKINFSATITNIGSRAATRTVTQYRRDYRLMWSDETMSWYREWYGPYAVARVSVTLAPGASYNYVNLGEIITGTNAIADNEPAQNWLEDSEGYKSAVLTVTAHY